MARTSRNTHDDSKNRKKVVAQVGMPVVDNEINELQDILMVEAVEGHQAAVTSLRSAQAGEGVKPLYAAGDAWLPYADAFTPGSIFLTAGTVIVDGYRLTLPTDIELDATYGITWAVTANDQLGVIYADITLEEVDSVADATIATPNVGETTLRNVLSVTFGQTAEDEPLAGGMEDVYDAMPGLPIVADSRIWKNNTARVIICRYTKPAANAGVTLNGIVDMRAPTGGEVSAHPMHMMLTGHPLTWDATTGLLQFSAVVSTPGGATVNVTQGTQVATALTGGGNADGTPNVPQAPPTGGGWVIANGSCLGWLATGATGTRFSQLLRKPSAATLADDANYLTGGFSSLRAQKLTVATAAVFASKGDPSTEILVTRVGNDLHWWNGHVTRGTTAHTVLDNPCGTPKEYAAVFSQQESGTVTADSSYAYVESFLNFSTTGAGASTTGTNRSLTARIRRGSWDFSRKVQKYGTSAEIANQTDLYANDDPCVVELVGDGASCTRVRFRNTETASRVAGNLYCVEITASIIRLKGITFSSVESSTFRIGYLLKLHGALVELEDCTFVGPVDIQANRVLIKNCRFDGVANTYENFSSVGGYATAQHLKLTPASYTGAPTPRRWRIEDCVFNTYGDVGTHASVLVNDTSAVDAVFSECTWGYLAYYGQPSVHAMSSEGRIRFTACTFAGARGMGKAGLVEADGEGATHLTSYAGIPMNAFPTQGIYTACAYLSVTGARANTSEFVADGCTFSMADIGGGVTGSPEYVVWGCGLVIVNYLSVGSSANVRVSNVHFRNNHCTMSLDSAQAYWDVSVAKTLNPALWGFGAALPFTDGAGITNFLLENFTVENNYFDVGGESTGAAPYFWRSTIGGYPADWTDGAIFSGTLKLLCLRSFLAGVILNNSAASQLGATYGGRSALGVKISKNRIAQRGETGSSPLSISGTSTGVTGALSCPTQWTPIVLAAYVDEGEIPNMNLGYLDTTQFAAILAPEIDGNTIARNTIASVHLYNDYGSCAGMILLIGTMRARVIGNNLLMLQDGNTCGVHCGAAGYTLVHGNIVVAYSAVQSQSGNYAAGNLLRDSVAGVTGGVDTYNTNDNFT